MRKVIAVAMASTLAFSAFSQADDIHWHSVENQVRQNSQGQMFDGIRLTEHQRQQMRDLMQQARHSRPVINMCDMETMHRFVTADKFDETAVRVLAEKMAEAQVNRQIEMARIRNQMYHLLTPEQQVVLKDNHQQRMIQLREVARMQHGFDISLLSSNARSNQ